MNAQNEKQCSLKLATRLKEFVQKLSNLLHLLKATGSIVTFKLATGLKEFVRKFPNLLRLLKTTGSIVTFVKDLVEIIDFFS